MKAAAALLAVLALLAMAQQGAAQGNIICNKFVPLSGVCCAVPDLMVHALRALLCVSRPTLVVRSVCALPHVSCPL